MKLQLALAASAAALLVGSSASASIAVGDTIQINYLFPSTGSIYQSNSTTYAGAGTTLPIIYTGTATFFDNLVSLTDGAGTSYTPAAFNGVQISDLTNPGAFAGWVVLPGATHGYNSYYQSGGAMYVDWAGQPTGGTLQLGPGVPEPATWALMIGGFGLAGAALRRRRLVAA